MSETIVEFRVLGAAHELEDDSAVPYYLEDRKHRVTVARTGEMLYAFDDLCSCADRACPLSSGLLRGATIMCQCHGSQFDLATGAILRGPATETLRTYEVRELDGTLQVRI